MPSSAEGGQNVLLLMGDDDRSTVCDGGGTRNLRNEVGLEAGGCPPDSGETAEVCVNEREKSEEI